MRQDGSQERSFAKFVRRSTVRTQSLQNQNWRRFANNYNGPNYEENDYHNKLKNAYDKHK